MIAFIAIMFCYRLVSAVDYSVATIAIVVSVIIYVVTNEFCAAFITVSIAIIVVAPDGSPYAAIVANVITFTVLVAGVIRIFLTFSFLTTNVASRVLVLVDMIIALQLCTTFIALPITISIYAYVRHPTAALITAMVAIFVYMILAKLLHTVSGSVAILTSAVVGPVAAIVA